MITMGKLTESILPLPLGRDIAVDFELFRRNADRMTTGYAIARGKAVSPAIKMTQLNFNAPCTDSVK